MSDETKKIIIKMFNILMILSVFCLIVYLNKYTALIHHSYIYPWFEHLEGRFPSQSFEFLFNNFLPRVFDENPNDFRSGLGIGCIILSFLSFCISFLFSLSFYLSVKDKLNLLERKEFGFILLISFLLMTIPIGNIGIYYPHYSRLDDLSAGAEYFLSYLPFFAFLIFLYYSIVKPSSYSIKNPLCIIGMILCFVIGSYNELFNLTAFFCSFIFVLLIYLLKRENIIKSKKQLLFPIVPLLLGMFNYYIISNNFFDIIVDSYNNSFCETIKNGMENIKIFISSFYFTFIKTKLIFWFIIIFLSIFLKVKNKTKDVNIIFVWSLILGYIIPNILMVFVMGLTETQILFEREFFNVIYVNILEFSILVLLGELYFGKNVKKIIIVVLSILLIYLANLFNIHISTIQEIKFNVKKSIYIIDKYNLIYSLLGETTILPERFSKTPEIVREAILLSKDDSFSNDLIIGKDVLNKHFSYESFFYTDYFTEVYNRKLIGIMFVDDKTADEELNKRLELLDEKIESDEELRKNNICFKPMYKKYKNKNLTLEDLLNLQKTKGNSKILLKAIASKYFYKGQIKESIKYYVEYLKYVPNDFDARTNLSIIYMNEKEYIKAEKELKKLQEIDKDNIYTLYKLFILYLYYLPNKEKAIECCDKIIKIKAQSHWIYINKAIAYSVFNDNENAKKQIEIAKEIGMNSANEILENVDEYNISDKLRIMEPSY